MLGSTSLLLFIRAPLSPLRLLDRELNIGFFKQLLLLLLFQHLQLLVLVDIAFGNLLEVLDLLELHLFEEYVSLTCADFPRLQPLHLLLLQSKFFKRKLLVSRIQLLRRVIARARAVGSVNTAVTVVGHLNPLRDQILQLTSQLFLHSLCFFLSLAHISSAQRLLLPFRLPPFDLL